jgi:hypothetical protein
MNTTLLKPLNKAIILMLSFIFIFSCQNDDNDLQEAQFSNNPYVFTDNFIGLGSDFYFPYGGSKFTSFSVDKSEGYNSNASIRIDVPNSDDLNGAYAGGIFRIDGPGRNLTEYNALTFWVKASQGVNIGEFGFGEDFGLNKYITTIPNVSVGTSWSKVIIPIPDASKLLQERGVFRYAAGTQGTGGSGYILWIDEIKFEKLGTIAHPKGTIAFGNNITETSFIGVNSDIEGIQFIVNMPNAINLQVNASPYYFNFKSSDPAVATVSENGIITTIGSGTSVITASLGSIETTGSVTIKSLGSFSPAPIPNLPPEKVISIFSDTYTNVPVNYYNGYWAPWQTTVSNDFSVQGNNLLNYNLFNFVGIEFTSPTINATMMTHIHLDVYIPGPIAPGRQLRVIVVDFGNDKAFNGGDDTRHSTTFTAPKLVSGNWVSIDIPFSSMTGLVSRTNLAQIILEGGDGSSMYVDNIYFYKL